MATTRELLAARATRVRRPTPDDTARRSHAPAQRARPVSEAPGLLRAPAVAQRGNSSRRAAAILQLQRAIGNRATRRLVGRGPTPVQRQPPGPPVVIQRAIHPKAERVLNYALEREAGQDYVIAKGTLEQAPWLSQTKQADIIHLRTKAEKNKNIDDEALTHRLELTRAMLLAVYVKNLRMEVTLLGDQTMRSKRSAETKAYNDTIHLRDNLKGWGLIKPGALRIELAAEMREADAENLITPTAEIAQVGPRIEVRGTSVPNAILGKLKKVRLHSFIVYTAADGTQRYIAAHSDPNYGDDLVPSPLHATVGLYRPGVHEWDPGADHRVLEDQEPQTEGKWERMVEAANQINAMMKPYKTLKRNCNTAAYYVLTTAGVNNIAPPGPQYVGWGKAID